ncbi:ABC transporter substrate-binding protein [Phyllobacterium sophorae]|uniref:ABC transporter n=1 Tax=Phyllobacterium sophorae TaxID=1520277 RepID=A0A2P7BFL1_9HYPH|nr:ABC transporter substrate-binding protein [Phyllobacterium sophorae]PSH65225.1 ABC transporter [Phyllobacterium sophorae]
MKIGVHPSNLHLRLAQVWPNAFASLGPEFVNYPEGRDTARLLNSRAIDFGGTGSTPPITAEVEGLDVIYIAASAPRPANGGIFVLKDSPIRSVGDLENKRVSLIDGSFHTYLLARSLETEGLLLPDVTRVETGAGDALPALLEGRVDAWIAMAPRLEKALERTDIRLIARCGSTIPNRSLFWTLGGQGLSADLRQHIVVELVRIGREVTDDPRRAALRLAENRGADADVDAWEKVVRSRDFSVVPADENIIAEQQEEADTLYRHGHFKTPVRLGQSLQNT